MSTDIQRPMFQRERAAKPQSTPAVIHRLWHPQYMSSDHVKKAVSEWARNIEMWPIEEIGNIVNGRLDLLLVPMAMTTPVFKQLSGHWTTRLGLVGVEVKVDRGDFLNGLKKGQFARYCEDLCGLYIAGPPDVVKLKEVPEEHGVLHVGMEIKKEQRIVCRRHPRFKSPKQYTQDEFWRILWAIAGQLRAQRRREEEKSLALERRIKDRAGIAIWKAIKACTDGARAERGH